MPIAVRSYVARRYRKNIRRYRQWRACAQKSAGSFSASCAGSHEADSSGKVQKPRQLAKKSRGSRPVFLLSPPFFKSAKQELRHRQDFRLGPVIAPGQEVDVLVDERGPVAQLAQTERAGLELHGDRGSAL